MQYGIFIVEFLFGFFTFVLLIRFYLSGGPFERTTHVSLAANQLTNWLVGPMNKFVPRAWGLELSALLAAYLVVLFELVAILSMHQVKIFAQPQVSLPIIVASALLGVFARSMQLFTAILIAGVVLSWFRVPGPIAEMIRSYCSRLLWPIRKYVPPVGGLDFSPLVGLFVAQLALFAATDAMGSLSAIFR